MKVKDENKVCLCHAIALRFATISAPPVRQPRERQPAGRLTHLNCETALRKLARADWPMCCLQLVQKSSVKALPVQRLTVQSISHFQMMCGRPTTVRLPLAAVLSRSLLSVGCMLLLLLCVCVCVLGNQRNNEHSQIRSLFVYISISFPIVVGFIRIPSGPIWRPSS